LTQPTVHITTELVFAIFDLLDKTFHPRIRDLESPRIFCACPAARPRGAAAGTRTRSMRAVGSA